MKTAALALAAALLTAGPALGATQVHSVDYSYSLADDGDAYPRLAFPGFDDQGGTRTLTRVDVRVRATVAATLAIENRTDAPLEGWTLQGQHQVLTGFDRQDPEVFGPFAFMGGLNVEPIAAELMPSDGTAASGSDHHARTDAVTIDATLDMDPGYLDFFAGGGQVWSVIGPFTESFLDGATPYDEFTGEGDATVGFVELSQVGTLSVIYTYDVVPEPTATLGFIVAAAAGLRRCR